MPPPPRQKFKLPRNPYILFAPFLVFYVLIVLILQNDGFWGDEERYYVLAQHLIHGYYSSPAPNISFENGPGYPIIIAPFAALHLPLVFIKLLNPLFHYLSVVFLFKTLRQFVSFKMAFIFCLAWASYYNAFEFMPLMYVESLAIFLITLILFSLTRAFGLANVRKYIILSGFLLGYLALTKIVFGYVLLILLIGAVVSWAITRQKVNYRRSVIILAIAFATTAPYLVYTYSLTGRIFYWGTSSGTNLYWMTAPRQAEYGNWYADIQTGTASSKKDPDKWYGGGRFNLKNRVSNTIPGINDSLRLYHGQDFEEINQYTGVERDDAFKRIAFRNIKAYPLKYLKNCFSNVGRMLFNYPYSYSIQKPGTLLRLPLNGIVVVLILVILGPTIINWKRIPFFLRFALFFVFIYVGGSTLECAEFRMFTIVVPMLLAWIAIILQKSVSIKLWFDEIKG